MLRVEAAQIRAHVLPGPAHPPLLRVHQAGDGAQQAGLARPVGSGQLQALPLGELELHAAQHMAFAAPQVQIFDLEGPG